MGREGVKEGCLFSVMIANYNNGKYISMALESIFNQSYKNWEIVIVDDASTDGSMEIITPFLKDKRISLYQNQTNKGCGFTKDRCIQLAHGVICGFLDPDDTLTYDALEVMVNAHLDSSDHSLCYSTHYLCDQYLSPINIFDCPRKLPLGYSYLDLADGSISQFSTFSRKLYLLTAGIDQGLLKAVDQDLYYKLEEVGDLVFINKPLYYYRLHDNGISSGKNVFEAGKWNQRVREQAYLRRLTQLDKKSPRPLVQSLSLKYHDLATRNAIMERDFHKMLLHSFKYILLAKYPVRIVKHLRRIVLAYSKLSSSKTS
jgi:glycosyltransferase involved in cell wall biosynthesis